MQKKKLHLKRCLQRFTGQVVTVYDSIEGEWERKKVFYNFPVLVTRSVNDQDTCSGWTSREGKEQCNKVEFLWNEICSNFVLKFTEGLITRVHFQSKLLCSTSVLSTLVLGHNRALKERNTLWQCLKFNFNRT